MPDDTTKKTETSETPAAVPTPAPINESRVGMDAAPIMTMPHAPEDLSKAPAPVLLHTKLNPMPQPEHLMNDSLAEQVGLPKIAGTASNLEPAVPHLGPAKMADHLTTRPDIAHILQEVKLPERHDFRASGDKVDVKNALTVAMPQSVERPPMTVSMPTMDAGMMAQATAPAPAHDSETVESVHTLKQDLQSVVQEQKVSFVHAVALEEDKKRARAQEQAAQDPAAAQRLQRMMSTLFAVALLVITGGAALFGVYYVMQQRMPQQTAMPAAQQDSLLFAEQTVALPIDALAAGDIKQTLARMRNSGGAPVGAIIHIVPTVIDASSPAQTGATAVKRAVTTQEFLKALGLHVSDEFGRSLGSTFFLGLHTAEKTAPVLVIPVVSYDRAFAAMLAWEPMMNTDLMPLFTAVPPTMKDPTDGALKPRTFQDTVMRNFDVRALKDDGGTAVLYYSFPTPNLLIIAESPYSFSELLARLQAGRKL